MIYAWILAIPILFFLVPDVVSLAGGEHIVKKEKNISRVSFAIVTVMLAFLLGIRYGVGQDYAQYYNVIIPDAVNHYGHIEPLFALLSRLVYPVGGASLVITIVSIITVCFWMLAIKQQSPYIVFSIVYSIGILFVSFFMSGIRQGLAMSIFLYAYKYIEKKQWKRYYLCIVFAIGFHSSAMLYLPVYFLNRVKFRMRNIFVFPTTLLLSPFISKIMSKISAEIGLYTAYLSSGSVNSSDLIYDVSLILLEVLTFLTYWKLPRNIKNKDQVRLGMNFQILILFMMGLIYVLPTSTRIIMLISSLNILIVPKLISYINDSRVKVLLIISFSTILLFIFYNYIIKYNYYETMPYSIQWNGLIFTPKILN